MLGSVRRWLFAVSGTTLLLFGAQGQALATSPGTASAPNAARYQGQLSAQEAAKLAVGEKQPSIIILKNQHPEVSAHPASAARRAQTTEDEQSGVKTELNQVHAQKVKSLHIVNAVAATITKAEGTRLAARPEVQAVVPDLPLQHRKQVDKAAAQTGTATPRALQQLCPPDPKVPLLEPEALQLMHVENQPGDTQPAAHDLANGAGVTVAFIADGLDINNPEFQRDGRSIFVDYQDFSGEGTNAPTDSREAFGDAGSIAAQGNQSYDLSQVVNPAHPLPPGCNIKIKGVAPGVNLVGLKTFGERTQAFNSYFLQAIEYAVSVDHVNVLNESFGANVYPDKANDPISLANAAAVAAGVTVTVSSGDAGLTNTIGTPSDAPGVIGVGASTQFRLYKQTSSYATSLSAGGWVSDQISTINSAGFTQFGPQTVDLVAPGDLGWSVCTPDLSKYLGCTDFRYGRPRIPEAIQAFGGTSESAPLVAGEAALVIQAYRQSHGGANPTPELVKQVITGSADDLDVVANEQGTGRANAYRAVQTALSVHDGNGSPTGQGNGVITQPTRLISTANAGTDRAFNVKVTNTSNQAQTVSAGVRTLKPTLISHDTGEVNLAPGSSPTFIDERGRPTSYVQHDFQVPNNVQRLDGDIAWNDQAVPNSTVRLTIFDPFGRVVGYSLPQGASAGFGHVDVHNPTPGTWTAIMSSVNVANPYSGTVRFSFSTQRFESGGSVTPSRQVVQPGGTATFKVQVDTPASAGDRAASVVLTHGGTTSTIPVTLRALIPINGQGGDFSGVFTGGNGRPIFGSQVFTYQFDVPRGRSVLNLAVKFQDPGYNVQGLLVTPSGQPINVESTNSTPTMQFFQDGPAAGRWTAILLLNGPISGNLREPFTAKISFSGPPVTATRVPNSPGKVLGKGKAAAASVTIKNTGNSTKDFFLDPRLQDLGILPVTSLNPTVVQMPTPTTGPASSVPAFLVPTHTSILAVGANSTVPIDIDVSYNTGAPDVQAYSFGNSALDLILAPQLAPGLWFAAPTEVGPFGPDGAPTATANTGAVILANRFDTSITSSTGDLWLGSQDLNAPYTPLTLAPGASGTITVTITPNAPVGTVVRGFLDVDTFNGTTFSGDQVTSIPYTYKVG